MVCSMTRKAQQGKSGETPWLVNKRMVAKTWTLWLLLVWMVLSLGSCQHWSFGLSPGGKRELDGIPNTQDRTFKGLAHRDAPDSVLGCAEKSPFARIYRMKELLAHVAEREHRHQAVIQ
ncbi:hypothetical protein ATANTOWER_030419 [Ataeniobius toweri]|uniref:Gonadoliberin n=2 Tax=Goodeidae TaxID=28758 RepID=A0ABU7BL90_9TELE|nr:hypothetical protein [Ataeniobius toweri]